ncbi:hypothetical protein HX127_06330 [Acinetobacter sp. 256-1]|uniref:hypothetical protein n=1 Tax=Acinetobacter sp. 256-1 TaxID=2746721 RepID=UPI0025788ADF|nr:hypothetical protein [Acinetobacter sp. 256-1]MDM1757201.1 hypothetical protein [Acinetobacter sp. 256-1]
MAFDFLIATVIAIFAFLATLVGSYYARNSYLLTLKAFEKDKRRTEKAKHYYDTYINIPPSKYVSPFLKKIDSDDLNESVKLPAIFTDYIIKNYPDRYFYFIANLKKCWTYFEIYTENSEIKVICKVKYFHLQQIGYFCLYILFAMFVVILGLYNDLIINKISESSPWGALYFLGLGIIFSIIFMFASLFKTTQMSDIKRLNNEFKKIPHQ